MIQRFVQGGLLFGLLLVGLGPGCTREAPPPPVIRSEQIDSQTLMRFAHVDDMAWLRVDLAALRSDAALAAVWNEGSGGLDARSRVLLAGDELLMVWHDLSLSRRTAVVRGTVDRAALENDARAGAFSDGGPMQLVLQDDVKIWKDPATQQSLAMPAANLLMVGELVDVQLQVLRQRQSSTATTTWAGAAEGHMHVTELQKRLLRGQVPEVLSTLLEPLQGVRGTLTVGETWTLTLRLEMVPGTVAASLQPLVAQLLVQVLQSEWPEAAPVLQELLQIGAVEGEQPALVLSLAVPGALLGQLLAPLVSDGRSGSGE